MIPDIAEARKQNGLSSAMNNRACTYSQEQYANTNSCKHQQEGIPGMAVPEKQYHQQAQTEHMQPRPAIL